MLPPPQAVIVEKLVHEDSRQGRDPPDPNPQLVEPYVMAGRRAEAICPETLRLRRRVEAAEFTPAHGIVKVKSALGFLRSEGFPG